MRRRRFLELAGGGIAGTALTATVAAPAHAAPVRFARGAPPFATVAADGTGDFATIQAAVDAVPSGNAAPLTVV